MTDLWEFLDKYHVEHSKESKHSTAGWTQIRDCPECGSDNFHLGIKDDMTRASCFRCGSKFVPTLLKTLSNASWKEIRHLIGQQDFVAPDANTEVYGGYKEPCTLYPIREVPQVANYLIKDRQLHTQYLQTVWGVRATDPFSDYAGRAFIPIYRWRRPVSWTLRATDPDAPLRYRNAGMDQKSYDEKSLLFGANLARDTVIITEGPFDAMRIGPGAVATLGLTVTAAQFGLMLKYPRRFICLDNQPQAQIQARKLADDLAAFPGQTTIVTLDAKDPGCAPLSEIRALRKLAFNQEEINWIL